MILKHAWNYRSIYPLPRLPFRNNLHRVAIRIDNPSGAQATVEEVVRRGHRLRATGEQISVGLIDIVGPETDLSACRSITGRDCMHLLRRLN